VVSDPAINLTYHGIGDPVRPLDPGEADIWVSRAGFLRMLDVVQARADVRLSFDDGNASDIGDALPALRDRGLQATFFLVAGRLGTPGYVDADGVKELVSAGMRIGSHGMHHRRWRGLDDAALHEEHVVAKAILEDVSGLPVTHVACPYGSYDRRVLQSLRRAGFTHVYTSDRGLAHLDDFLQARNSVTPRDEPKLLEDIASMEAAAHKALARRAKLAVKRWR
jgi:peptidoglycan/xylan/chitin deacetylase (PgdA/CDA1 family)